MALSRAPTLAWMTALRSLAASTPPSRLSNKVNGDAFGDVALVDGVAGVVGVVVIDGNHTS